MKKITLFLFAGLLLNISMFSQTVTTFTSGTPDDAIALDSNGNIYCSNYVGDSVFKFTTTGNVSSFVTGLNTPNGLAFNSNDELYVCDGVGNTVYKYDVNGNQLASYNNTGHPSGVLKAFDSETMIFTEYLGNTINTLDPDETILEFSDDSLLVGPVGLAYDDDDNLYVGNYTNRKVYKVLSDGSLVYIATVGNGSNLGFIAYGRGMLWGTVLGEHKIYKINPNGIDDVTLFAGSTGGSMDGDISVATFNQPNGIAFNAAEDIMYITDFGSKNLRVITDLLGVDDRFSNSIDLKVFPNPTSDTITLNWHNSNEEYSMKVLDMTGKLLFEKTQKTTASDISLNIDVSWLASGTYLVEVNDGDQTITKKFIK